MAHITNIIDKNEVTRDQNLLLEKCMISDSAKLLKKHAWVRRLSIVGCKITTFKFLPSQLSFLSIDSSTIDGELNGNDIPNSLSELSITGTSIKSIVNLPSPIVVLRVSNVRNLTSHDYIPNGVRNLNLANNELLVIPTLPYFISDLNISGNQMITEKSIVVLKNNVYLKRLDISCTGIKDLSVLPDCIEVLSAGNCNLLNITSLPKSLQKFSAPASNIYSIVCVFPKNLDTLVLNNNNLSRIPILPESMRTINLANNNLLAVPKFNDGIAHINLQDNTYLKRDDVMNVGLDYPNAIILQNCASDNWFGKKNDGVAIVTPTMNINRTLAANERQMNIAAFALRNNDNIDADPDHDPDPLDLDSDYSNVNINRSYDHNHNQNSRQTHTHGGLNIGHLNWHGEFQDRIKRNAQRNANHVLAQHEPSGGDSVNKADVFDSFDEFNTRCDTDPEERMRRDGPMYQQHGYHKLPSSAMHQQYNRHNSENPLTGMQTFGRAQYHDDQRFNPYVDQYGGGRYGDQYGDRYVSQYGGGQYGVRYGEQCNDPYRARDPYGHGNYNSYIDQMRNNANAERARHIEHMHRMRMNINNPPYSLATDFVATNPQHITFKTTYTI